MDRIPIIANAQTIDLAISCLQKNLANKLEWLDHSFGRAERLVKIINGKKYYSPNVYVGGNEYRDVSPDSDLGNFSFFTIDDPQTVDWMPGIQSDLSAPMSIIVWFDMRRVTGDDNNRNTEAVKNEILNALNMPLGYGSIKINKIYQRAENIYSGFTLDEVDNQFLMHPYAGFKFTGTIFISQPCL